MVKGQYIMLVAFIYYNKLALKKNAQIKSLQYKLYNREPV